jgi:methionine salvage enolase-phosphatase E1
MFIPPWYQPPIVQPISEPTTKLPYKKIQYPTYVKDTNSDAHIKVFQKAIKANGEIVEVDIIILFGLFSRIIDLNGEKTMFKTIQNAPLKSWNKHFVNNSKL